jgi:8-oxo-dGTP pyrophosphatase MutT (NUDIX family)
MEGLSTPIYAEFPARNLVTGCGVAIFHIKSERVVLCYHTRDKYWFLPKGRRDAGEETRRAAEREGFEEVCLLIQSRA